MLLKTNVSDVNRQEKSEKVRLTGSAAVHAEVVALCVADGLQSRCFALAAPASLKHTHVHTLTPLSNEFGYILASNNEMISSGAALQRRDRY